MKNKILLIIILLGIFFIETNYLNKLFENETNKLYNLTLEEGFKLGVECRGILTSESCFILFERIK